MKILGILFIIFQLAYADEVKIELNPTKPVAGEVFQAYIRIFTDSDQEPYVNFVPSSLEVVGKSNQGISTRTVYANGKLTVTREITLSYDLVAARPGIAGMREITVQLGDKTLRHPSITINVLKEAEEVPEVFVMADVPKKSLFLGEGVTVRYYLYSKVPVNNLDVKKYPKLNNFLKRFLQEPDRSERVSVDGQLFLRNQIYAAKLFPEKLGELKIDPIQLSATYAASRGGHDPFANFGFNREMKTKSITSEVVKIEVKPLPPLGSNLNFTGLIGKHDFEVTFGKSKLIVNEPLEVKLTVTGGGALENLEAPTILENPGLEEFESNGDLKIMDADHAVKTFDYTFLPNDNLKIPSSLLTLSYFDPDSQKYIPVQLSIPEITVAGAGAGVTTKSEDVKPEVKETNTMPESIQKKTQDLARPLFRDELNYSEWIPYLNLVLGGLSLVLALSWIIKKETFPKIYTTVKVPSVFKKGEFSFSEFSKWVSPIVQRTGKSPLLIIKDSPLKEEAKVYFIDLLNANDYKSYSARKNQTPFNYQASHFKELGRYIESVENENSPEST